MPNQPKNKVCMICGNACSETNFTDCTLYDCEECGTYKTGWPGKPELSNHHKVVLKQFYTTLDPLGQKRLDIKLTRYNIDEIVESIDYPKTLIDKINRVLAYVINRTEYFGQAVTIKDVSKATRLLFCVNNEELNKIFAYLVSKKYLLGSISTPATTSLTYTATTEGLEHYYENIVPKLKTKQAFVAMWFNEKEDLKNYKPNMQDVYVKAIKPAIENDNKYNAIKIDNVEHCNDINDEMIAQIRKSKFMVVDLTGYRGGVYYEAGFAEGLGLKVIYTCHEKWLEGVPEMNIERVHFDINHRNIIVWNDNNLEEFKTKLINRIDAVII